MASRNDVGLVFDILLKHPALCLDHQDEFCYNAAIRGVNSRLDDKALAWKEYGAGLGP